MKHIKRIPIFVRTAIISDKQFSFPYTKPYGYIYKITNQINGHYYIGKHEFHYPWLDKSYKGSGKLLWKAYEKYGIENFETIILEWTDKDNNELNRLEKLYISVFHANEIPNYNLTEGGDGVNGELIKGENNPMKRPEVVQKNSASKKDKHTGEDNPMYGVDYKEEWKEKQRIALNHKFQGRDDPIYSELPKGKDHPFSKVIYQFDSTGQFLREFESMCQAETLTGLYHSNISDVCNGKYKQYKGYLFSFLPPDERGHIQFTEKQLDLINKPKFKRATPEHVKQLFSVRYANENNPNAKRVYQYSLDGFFITEFKFLKQISRVTPKIKYGLVGDACRLRNTSGIFQNKRVPYKNYLWSFLPPVDNYIPDIELEPYYKAGNLIFSPKKK